MIVYILMLIISVILLVISNKIKNKWIKIFIQICSVIPLFLVSAFRFDLGTDYTKRYVDGFNFISHGIDVKNLEISFVFLIKICIFISNNPNLLFIFTSFIILALIMGVVFFKSENKILSLLIFVLGGFYFESMNLIRQYISIGLILAGSMFLLKDNWKYYIIFILSVVLATTFHTSAIITIVLLVLNRKALTNWKWVIPICGLIVLLHNQINACLMLILKYTNYYNYIYVPGEFSNLCALKNLLIYIVMQYIYSYNKKIDNVQNSDILFLNVQGLVLITFCLGACNFQFSRIAIYFSIFQIISIPYFISKLNVCDIEKWIEKILKTKKVNVKCMANVITVCFFTILLVYTNVIHNDNGVIPYKTILNKDIHITNFKIEKN